MNAAMSPGQQPETATCYLCNRESPLVDFFHNTQKGHICPRCMPRAADQGLLIIGATILGFGILAALHQARSSSNAGLLPLLNIVLFVALIWLTILFHEAVHAIAAWGLGGRVYEVALGAGELRRAVEWRGTRFSVRQGLYLGYCLAAFPQRRQIRLRWGLFVMAPLTMQILLILWLWPAANVQRYGVQIAFVETLILVNVLTVALNLFPSKSDAMFATDGYYLWELLRQKRRADDLHALYFIVESARAYEHDDFQAMQVVAAAGTELYPANDLLRNQQAGSYLLLGRYNEALAYFEQLLTEPSAQAPSVTRAIFLCNRAASLLSLALEPGGISQEQMSTALASADEAYYLIPWVPAAEIVHALSIHHRGRHEVAIEILEQILEQEPKANHQANLLAYIALAQHSLKQRDAARATLARSRRIYPKGGYSVASVEAIVGVTRS